MAIYAVTDKIRLAAELGYTPNTSTSTLRPSSSPTTANAGE